MSIRYTILRLNIRKLIISRGTDNGKIHNYLKNNIHSRRRYDHTSFIFGLSLLASYDDHCVVFINEIPKVQIV